MNMNNVWENTTTVHPLGLAVLCVLGVALLALPRRFAVVPLLLLACTVSSAQRIVIQSLDFNFLRILVLVGWVRVVSRAEFEGFRWRSMDTVIVLWAISGTIAFTVLQGTPGALINRLGWSFDSIGLYFLFRMLIREISDLETITRSFVFVSIPVLLAFLIESSTGHNAFSAFGGVPEVTLEREGRLRCQGAFSHPIMAGCFFVATLPLLGASLWRSGRSAFWIGLGIFNTLGIVYLCASSTPIMLVFLAIFAALMYYRRHYIGLYTWVGVATLFCLHLIMRAPVWHLVSRIDILGGSTGWHRYHLIDKAIANFDEWWIAGTTSTASWGWGLNDVTNQYVLEGVRGGVLSLILFVVTLWLGFKSVGIALRRTEGHPYHTAIVWALGSALFMSCVSFLAVSYFGQMTLMWYLILAMVGGLPTMKWGAERPEKALSTPQSRSRAEVLHGVPQNKALSGPSY